MSLWSCPSHGLHGPCPDNVCPTCGVAMSYARIHPLTTTARSTGQSVPGTTATYHEYFGRCEGQDPDGAQPKRDDPIDILEAIIFASDQCEGHMDCAHSMIPWIRARAFLAEHKWHDGPLAAEYKKRLAVALSALGG